ncbi:MAG TPA: hypothetical protein VF208_01960 [Candidatus Binatia bacterium]
MDDAAKRLFVGIKITRALQEDLDSPAPGMKQYFDANNDYLQIVDFGESKFIGRYLNDGYPVANLADVSRNVCSIVKLITRGKRIEENDVQIYSC